MHRHIGIGNRLSAMLSRGHAAIGRACRPAAGFSRFLAGGHVALKGCCWLRRTGGRPPKLVGAACLRQVCQGDDTSDGVSVTSRSTR